MNNKILTAINAFIICASVLAGVTRVLPVFAHHLPIPTLEECQEMGGRITICHATSSETNPYVEITIACQALYGANGNAGHFDENGSPLNGHEDDFIPHEGESCSPVASPTPTPTPTPSPTPNPSATPQPSATPSSTPGTGTGGGNSQDGKQTSLGNDNLQCTATTFDATMDIKENGTGVKDVLVTFVYNGSVKQARTNDNGRAKVSYDQNGNGTLSASADGWNSQSMALTMPLCGNVNLDPDRTKSTGRGTGQVLGATTLADTGRETDYLTISMMLAGMIISSVSLYGFYTSTKK